MSVKFIGGILVGLLLTEVISYVVHRFLFHGPLWEIHKTHHFPQGNVFEKNDLFLVFFTSLSVILVHFVKPLGTGMALYGLCYFLLHDIFTHNRFYRLNYNNKFLKLIKRNHRLHHRSVEKQGQEPFGFLFFGFKSFTFSNWCLFLK